MSSPIIQRTFAGGELAPVLHARADTTKYLSGLRTCRNFIVRREGGVTKRPGFRFVDKCKDNNSGKRLMRYVSEAFGGNVLIEIGTNYFRFYTDDGDGWGAVNVSGVPAYNGATNYVPGDLVVSGGVNYYCIAANVGTAPPNASFWYALTGTIFEIPTPYAAGEKFKWVQSGNVITITHPSHKPAELVYGGATSWVLRDISTGPKLSAPVGGAGTPGAAGALNYSYVVTAAAASTYEESNASSPIAVSLCAAPTQAAPNALTWTAVVGAAEYYVYCDPFGNGVYGYIGTASTNAFKDAGKDAAVPDFNVTPPLSRVLFNSANNYPGTAAYFQQRRFFGFTNLEPDSVFGSRIGFPSNFGISSPLQDDDAVTFRVAGNNHHPVRYLLALKAGLILMTDGGEWTVTGSGGSQEPITPNSLSADQETYVGVATNVRPVIIGNAIIYAQALGTIVRELQFAQTVEGLAGRDLTIFATHLFEGRSVIAMDFQQVPDSIVWFVMSDGGLIGLTYIPEQEVWGWHRHDTESGVFEDVCVVPGRKQDDVFAIVQRAVNGATVRYVEKLENRQIVSVDVDTFFVDSGLSYQGPPADTISGLEHLEGHLVAILGDGDVISDGTDVAYTVTAGAVDLPKQCVNVHVGLPIRMADVETLDLDVQGSDVRSKRKRIAMLTLLVEQSSRSFYAGPDETHLQQFTPQAWEGTATRFTGQAELPLTSEFTQYGRVLIRQSDPLPLTILGVIPDVDLGG